jgi:hypothetical protein
MISTFFLLLTRLLYGGFEFDGPPWDPIHPCPTSVLTIPHRNMDCVRNASHAYCRFPNMTLTHSVLTQCPAIESLYVYLEVGGCTGPERDRDDFPFQEGERYPSLKSLELDRYSFGGERVPIEDEEEQGIEEGYGMGPVREGVSWETNQYWRVSWIDPENERIREERKKNPSVKTNLELWLEAMD